MKRLTAAAKLIALALILPGISKAQDIEAIKKKFPGYDAVVLNHSIHYQISVKEGKPQAESREIQQLCYLSPAAASYMSKYRFVHSGFHQVQEYEAYTKTADSKKVKVTNFKTGDSKSDGIFYDDVKETAFDFPAISPGAVGTLELKMTHTNAHLLSPFYFTRRIPVVNSELKVSFPKNMSVKYVLRGRDTSSIKVKVDKKRNETIYSFTALDQPAERSYADAPDDSYYASHVIFYIESFTDESGKKQSFLSNVEDLYNLNYSFIRNINKEISKGLKVTVDSLCANTTDQKVKAKRIYNWVQNNIKYVAFEQGMEGFIPREANLVYERRFGDCKDMSSILTVMLNAAGVPAYYTWIGTRHLPYRYTEVPTPVVDNHMICTINLDGNYVFLDGTDPTCIFGVPSQGIQGKQALLAINEKEHKVLEVPVPAKEKNILSDTTFLEFTEKKLKGSIHRSLSGYYNMNIYGSLMYTREKDQEKFFRSYFSRGSNKFNLTAFKSPALDRTETLQLNANFELEDYSRKIGDEYFINLNLFRHYEHKEIDFPKRKIPIEFPYHFTESYVTVLKIPAGYKVAYLPENSKFRNDTWGFELKYEQLGDQVVFTQTFTNENLLLHNDKFEDWNKVLEHLFPNYNESISLIKNNRLP